MIWRGILLLAGAWLVPSGAIAAKPDFGGANPPVRVQMTEEGPVFATRQGRTLYSWARDDGTPGKSQCTGEHFTTNRIMAFVFPLPVAAKRRSCAEKWLPLIADKGARTGGAWSLITRDDGKRQWAYAGHPLYSSTKDQRPGDVNGNMERNADQAWRPALAPAGLPAGLKLVRRVEGLAIATADNRLLFRAKAGQGAALPLTPLAAPAIAQSRGDWTVTDSGTGQAQYAFRRDPLFLAPEGISDDAVLQSGEWQLALFKDATPVPPHIRTVMTLVGQAYAAPSGKLLYAFNCNYGPEDLACDDPGDAAVYYSTICGSGEECARQWQPLLADKGARPVGEWTVKDVAYPLFTDATDVTYPAGTPRVKAWAYKGRPVYTFADEEPGEMMGHGMWSLAGFGFYAVQVPGNHETGR
ncbi:hypothetical protein L288_07075 [Sphingobium quisquiliarum P25]|uniref:Lipoprotein n=1 Tax=Sphingobium quisquiliarum P25 TaxID=1329909 RepID=T0IGX7_9SPHN|nr:hypothetical protein [Sphingobium quisquiliarum]EQB08869.1 hypothetical protein L288_07075 [Sphingobium quisquiliarum P25]